MSVYFCSPANASLSSPCNNTRCVGKSCVHRVSGHCGLARKFHAQEAWGPHLTQKLFQAMLFQGKTEKQQEAKEERHLATQIGRQITRENASENSELLRMLLPGSSSVC